MSREPFRNMTFVKKDGKNICGRIYLSEKTDSKLPVVVFSHGLGANFRDLTHYGDRFAQVGICCLFFDFCGGGVESISDGKDCFYSGDFPLP